MHAWVWRAEDDLGVLPKVLYTLAFEGESLIGVWLASAPRSTCLHLLSSEIISICHHNWLLTWVLGWNTGPHAYMASIPHTYPSQSVTHSNPIYFLSLLVSSRFLSLHTVESLQSHIYARITPPLLQCPMWYIRYIVLLYGDKEQIISWLIFTHIIILNSWGLTVYHASKTQSLQLISMVRRPELMSVKPLSDLYNLKVDSGDSVQY